MSRLLIENGFILEGFPLNVVQGFLIVENDKIERVQEGAYVGDRASFDRVYDVAGNVVMPGLVNTHGHAAMTLLRGYADDLPLMEWLQTKIWPVEDRMTPEDIYWGTQLAIAEMLLSGTTAFADMYFHMDQVAQAVESTGIRAMLCRGLIGAAPTGEASLEDGVRFCKQWEGEASGRIRTSLGPHAPYTCPPTYMERVVNESAKLDVPLQVHLSETASENERSIAEFGVSPTVRLARDGVFTRPTIAAHCVHMSEEDLDILQSNRVRVAHNPASNLKLASGVAPLTKMLERNLTVGLGTDGASSNNRLDMFFEMRLAGLLHKGVTLDPLAIPAAKAVELATVGGARTLFDREDLGVIRPQAAADFIVIDFDQPHLLPRHDVLAHLAYAAEAHDVVHVFVAGKCLVESRKLMTIDLERVHYELGQSLERLFGGEQSTAQR